MLLTDEEKRMLDGNYGEAIQYSMQILVKIGDMYGAECLAEIQSAHVGIAYPEWVATVELIETFSKKGSKFKVPATVNAGHQPKNFNRWKDLPEPPEYLNRCQRMVDAVQSMGVFQTYSCTPYFQGNLPRFGQNVAWMESSAIVFANSVLGARANRISYGMDKAAAITGRIPYFGFLDPQNRKGNALVKVEYTPKNLMDYGTIGYIIGKHFGDKIPVIEGLPIHTTTNQLKVLGSAAAGRGAVALYHCVGLTPEARTQEEAFGGLRPKDEINIGPKEMEEALAEINTAKDGKFDAVLLGCPHPHIEEIRELALLLGGKRVKPGIKFWIFISMETYNLAKRLGYSKAIEDAGAEFVLQDCIMFFHIKEWGWKTAMTNSAKSANILPSEPTCLDVIYQDTIRCVAAATI